MSTPPPRPGDTATLDRQPPAEARSGPPEPRGTRFGTHQVIWGLCGLIVGLAGGIAGTAAESPAPAAAAPVTSVSAPAAAAGRGPAARAPAAAVTGTVMDGDGVFRVGTGRQAGDIRRGTWRTPGAIGGATGSCFVALLARAGAGSVLQSQIVTGPARFTTTPRTRAIRTSGCQPWHRVGG